LKIIFIGYDAKWLPAAPKLREQRGYGVGSASLQEVGQPHRLISHSDVPKETREDYFCLSYPQYNYNTLNNYLSKEKVPYENEGIR
jgi:hypothetical protein